MAVYAIGDVQGCFDELQALLDRVGFVAGSDRMRFELELPVEPEQLVIHLNTFHTLENLHAILNRCGEMGVKYILAISGDGSERLPKLDPEEVGCEGEAVTAVELIEYIGMSGDLCFEYERGPSEGDNYFIDVATITVGITVVGRRYSFIYRTIAVVICAVTHL